MRLELMGHEVFTAAYMNWAGIENGELLRVASAAGFQALITNDRGLEYEQNLNALPIAVVVLLPTSNTLEAVRPLYSMLLTALARLRPGEFVKVPST